MMKQLGCLDILFSCEIIYLLYTPGDSQEFCTLYKGRGKKMKKKLLVLLCCISMTGLFITGCNNSDDGEAINNSTENAMSDQQAADNVADLIDAIYVQERNENTDEQCKAAKEAWDALTDAQKALVEGENADPDYFGRDTGDASLDDPRNQDEIGENEILVVSFGTSFNDSRVADIKGVEDAIAAANPDWSVRRAFTAQSAKNQYLRSLFFPDLFQCNRAQSSHNTL